MGFAEKQIWLNEKRRSLSEPVFATTSKAHIETVTMKVVNEGMTQVEEYLLAMVSEFWKHPLLNDIKVMKCPENNEMLIISSWQDSLDSEESPLNLRENLKPLIAEGLILKFENNSNNYVIIE